VLVKQQDMVCPHCKGYFTYSEATLDEAELICPICNNIITEEDIEDVFAEDTAGANQEALQTEKLTNENL